MFRIVVASAFVVAAVPTQATILRFMPGDAFFHARFTQEVADSIPEDGGTIKLPYSGPDHAVGGLCGYAGFAELEVRNVPPEIARALRALRRESDTGYAVVIDRDGKETFRRETGSPRLFVYAKDFDPHLRRFGLKYNEDWQSPPPEAMKPDGRPTLKIPAAVYECYVRGEEAVIDDWRDAKTVSALPVKVEPYAAWGFTGAPIEQPAVVEAVDVRFYVLEDGDMRRYFRELRDVRFWEVAPAGFRAFYYERRGELAESEFPLSDVRRALEWQPESDAGIDDEPVAGSAEEWLTQ